MSERIYDNKFIAAGESGGHLPPQHLLNQHGLDLLNTNKGSISGAQSHHVIHTQSSNTQGNSITRGSNLLANKQINNRQQQLINQNFGLTNQGGSSQHIGGNITNINMAGGQSTSDQNQKIKFQIGRKKVLNQQQIMVNSNQSRNEKMMQQQHPQQHNQYQQQQYLNSYQQQPNSYNMDSNNAIVNHNFSSRTVKGPMNNIIGGYVQNNQGQVVGGTQKMQFYINEGSQNKKQRRLRKNFDLLTQAIKNSNTSKKDKKINFSQDSRVYNNTGQLAPQIYQQNYVMHEQSSPQLAAKKFNALDNSIAQIYQYGAHIQQPFKDRKNSAYDALVQNNPLLHNQSQSQRVPSHHSNNSATNHNQSLYSQISIKESSQTPSKNLSYNQTRNQSMMIYQNLPNNTQPIIVSDQKQYMRVNDKLMRRFVINDNNQLAAPALQNLGVASGTNSQAILNINTASDINIYNNSFIVNTTSKKQSHSQNQSRSNSLKRNQQPIAITNQNAPSQRIINKQSSIQRIINQTQYNNGNSLLGVNQMQQALIQNDYQVKYNNGKPQSSTGRIHSEQRVNSQGQVINPNQTTKYNQIAEAYTTQPFFNQTGSSNSHLSQNSQGGNQILSMFQGCNQKYQSSSHNKTQSSKTLKKQQINHTQSFDLQPFNKNNEDHHGVNNQQHSMSTQNFPIRNKFKFNSSSTQVSKRQKSIRGNDESYPKLEDPNFSPQINAIDHSKKQMISQNLLNQGKAKLLEKDYNGAIKLCSESLQIDPTNTDAKFYRAVSYLDSGSNMEALSELQEVLKISQDHSQIAHILISIAYKRENNINESINILSTCIQKHPQYPDAFLARGQALLIQEKFDQALKDFQQYTILMPNQGIGFVGMGDCQKALKLWNESINSFTKSITLFTKSKSDDAQVRAHLTTTYLKRGLSYYYLKKNQQALSDLQKVTQYDPTQYKAHFYIGKLLSRQYAVTPRIPSSVQAAQRIQNDAILHFEQVVKHQLNEVYAGNALFEIAKLRLRDKDFYEAYFNLKRAVDSNFNSKRLQLYKDFTEGVLYLIKRKIKKGVQILSDLLEVLVNSKEKKDRKQLEHLKHQAYIYRAYGYVAIEKYEVALSDIKKAKKLSKLDQASIYNKLLGKGILRMDHEDYLMATKYFNKASARFSLNKDPYCLYIISTVRSYSYSMADLTVDNEFKKEKVMNAKLFMDQAIKNCYKVRIPSLFFFRGLLYFQLHMFYEALKDFNVAIEEEEEPTASYYLARGRCYACISILTEAMKDLSIALNLDDSLQEAYIYRGKCAYLLGDNNLAFLDFQRLILTDPKNPMVHVYAGNLLMTTGAYQDAIKAFMNADTVQKTAVAAFQRARCFCALTDIENAKMQFKLALDLCKNEYLVKIDSQCLSALMKVIASAHNQNQENKEKSIQDAIDIINSLMDVFKSPKIRELQKKDAKLNIQIIPNVKRIKVEKVAVAKELFAAQSEQKDLTISIDLTQTVDMDSLYQIPLYSYYYENVFQLEDFYLFRAVFNFYKKNYKEAVSDYEHCRESRLNDDGRFDDTKVSGLGVRRGGDISPTNNQDHAESMALFSKHSQVSTPISAASSKTDLSDVGLCSLNVHETNFNILLCYLMMKDMNKALERLSELIGQAPKKYQKYFFLIRSQVYEQLGHKDKSVKDMQKFEKLEPKLYEQYFKENKEIFFEPFPIKSRLCSKFETVRIQINPKRPFILTKPSFSMPFIKPPNMIPNIDEEVIQNEFTLKQIDAPMPEAPWIRRCEYGIKFTDDIMQDDENDEEDGQQELNQNARIMDIALSHDTQKEPTQKIKEETKITNAPLKGNTQRRDNINTYQDASPYIQSVEVTSASQLNNIPPEPISLHQDKLHTIPFSNTTPGAYNHKGIGERILQNATVYLVDGVDDDQLSDKHKISLFDDSKFEDYNNTLDNNTTINKQTDSAYHYSNRKANKTGGKNTKKDDNKHKQQVYGGEDNNNIGIKNKILLDDSQLNDDSLDQGDDELLNQDLLKAASIHTDNDDDEDDDEEDDDSSADEDDNGPDAIKAHIPVVFDRDSMVLVAESMNKPSKKKKGAQHSLNKNHKNNHHAKRGSNAILIASEDDDKQKLLSELQSNIDLEEEDQNNRESIFRSRQSSKR